MNLFVNTLIKGKTSQPESLSMFNFYVLPRRSGQDPVLFEKQYYRASDPIKKNANFFKTSFEKFEQIIWNQKCLDVLDLFLLMF